MIHSVWKNVFLFIAFSVIVNTSHGAPNKISNNLKKLAIANNDLGLKLYQILVKDTPGNVFFSPFSLSNAMGMLFDGAEGNTAKQLRSVLGYDAANLRSGEVPSAFNEYLNQVLLTNKQRKPDYVLNLANELLVSSNYDVSSNYKKDVQEQYHASIKEVNFEKNSAQIVNDVNSWVSKQTHGKIDKLLSDLDPSTALLILNAIYFKGNWKIYFDQKKTKQQKFYNDGLDSKAKEVPLMHMTAKLPYASVDDIKALELPYKGDNISMIILLPEEHNGLKSLEDSITQEKFLHIQKQLRTSKVIITFPKFKVEYKREMVPDFKELGAKDVLTPGQADLSGIAPTNMLYVNRIIHKAAIEVNEEGSEAAAATGIGLVPFSLPLAPPPPPPEFTADHPFMYAITDKRNGMILFLGRVTEL
nr:leukocyte elastase inhibitor-like isoform X2 [Parasteatoda tepidariorum]